MQRVGLIGFGSIAVDLVGWLAPDVAAGRLCIEAALVRDVERARARAPEDAPEFCTDRDELIERCDVIVECAGSEAAAEHGPAVIAAGRTLVLASVGALARPQSAALLMDGPGRLVVTTGAVGGLDALRAAAQASALTSVSITTSKAPRSLVRPWMADPQRESLEAAKPGDEPIELLDADPAKAIELFPTNVNVAVTVGWATRRIWPDGTFEPMSTALERVRVRLVADPSATASTHRVEASGPDGDFAFELALRPSSANPRSSALTAAALARDVRDLVLASAGTLEPMGGQS